MISTARLELPYPRVSRPSFWTKLLGVESNVVNMQTNFTCSSCMANMMSIQATKTNFCDELAFHRRDLCVSGSANGERRPIQRLQILPTASLVFRMRLLNRGSVSL